MKVYVTLLYKDGKLLSKNKKPDVFAGYLNMSDHLHPVLCRLVREASLLTQDGQQVVDPLIDVQLVSIGADGFRLRGVEYHKGVEQIQEWFVRPIFYE
jgi:hypothetical protein